MYVTANSIYHYTTEIHQGKKFLLIIDEFNGAPGIKTITNNIENVVVDICRKENLKAQDLLIIYKDTEGNWDGWDHVTQSFIGFGETNHLGAIDKFIARTK